MSGQLPPGVPVVPGPAEEVDEGVVGLDEELGPVEPPLQVFCWRSRTAAASAGHPPMMHMVAELTNEEPQMHLVSQGPEHLASPSALLRHPWAHDESPLMSGQLPPGVPVVPGPADEVLEGVVGGFEDEVGGGAEVVPPVEPLQVFCWRARTAEASAGHPPMMHMVAELTKALPQMHLVSHSLAHLASVRALARHPWAQEERPLMSGQLPVLPPGALEVAGGADVVGGFEDEVGAWVVVGGAWDEVGGA